MNHIPRYLLLVFLLMPLSGLGQSFQWYERLENPPPTGPFDRRQTYTVDLVASNFGVYALSAAECDGAKVCHGVLSKYRAEDGKLLWRRRMDIKTYTAPFALAVNERGVFVVGYFSDQWGFDQSSGSFVRHYSHGGVTEWTVHDQRVDRAGWDIALDTRGLYVIGSTYTSPGQGVIRHFDFEGERQWVVKLPDDTEYGVWIFVGDDLVYAYAGASKNYGPALDVYRTDGSFAKRIGLKGLRSFGPLVYESGFFYAISSGDSGADYSVLKYDAADGSRVWGTAFGVDVNGLNFIHDLATSPEGLVVSATMVVPVYGGYRFTGDALVRMDLNGSIIETIELPGYPYQFDRLSVHDEEIYVSPFDFGVPDDLSDDVSATARISPRSLLPPSLLALAGAAPTQPPRIAVLEHNYGAGPVRARIRDAAPGSLEYVTEFSEGIKPVAFGKIRDLDGNGYEELVVVSRFPALAEVRDSLDGRLLSAFKLGARFDAVAAAVEERDGEAPRLAILVRNPDNDRVLVRVHDPATGALLDTIFYHPGFNSVDVLPVPTEAGTLHRYAVLLQDPQPGAASRIEIRDADNAAVSNYFISSTNVPLALANMGPIDAPALGVLLRDTAAQRPRVRQIDLENAGEIVLRYSQEFSPLGIAAIPDIDGNGYPEISVLSTKSTGQVKAETRDGETGTLRYRVVLDRDLQPHDVGYVGAIPGFSDAALAFLQMRLTDDDTGAVDGSLVVSLVDGTTGANLFVLEFPATR